MIDSRLLWHYRSVWLVLSQLLLSACQPTPDTLTPSGDAAADAMTETAFATQTAAGDSNPETDIAATAAVPTAATITSQVHIVKPVRKRSRRALSGQNRHYDPSNPSYARLQKANQALAGFPADRMGRVDWVAALRRGLIKPRAAVRGQGQMQALDSEIIMTDTREMPWVRFPHAAHTEWLACKNCHNSIFKPQQGANQITMDTIFRGRHCGACHDRVAFSVFVCERCHSVTHAGSPDAWWTQ